MERVYTFTDENGKRYAVPKSETQEFFKYVPKAQLAGDFRDTKGNAYAVPGNDAEMGEFVAKVPDAKSSYRYRSKAGKDYVVPYDEMGDFLKTFRSDDAFKEERDEIDKRVEELASPKQSVAAARVKGFAVGAGLGLTDAARGISRAFTDQIPGLIYKPLAVMMGKDATKVGRWLSDVARDIDDRAEARKWDDPEIEGWASIAPGAFESVAANVVPAIATHGMSAYAMPALYGLSRAFDVHEAAMESGHTPEQAITLAAGAGAIEGGMEYVSMLWGGGKQVKEIGKAIGGKELARNARQVLRALVGEVLSEAGTEGIQEGVGNQYDQLAAGDDIDYRQSAVAAGMGAGTGAMAAIIQGGPLAAAKIDAARNPEQRASYTAGTSPQELAAWTLKNPDMALALAGKESPSRKDFEAAGLPRVPASERSRIAADLKELTTAETEQKTKSKGVKAGTEVAPDVMPGPSLITDDGKVFAPGETVPKGNYTINGQQVMLEADTPAADLMARMKQPPPAAEGEAAAVVVEDTVTEPPASPSEAVEAPTVTETPSETPPAASEEAEQSPVASEPSLQEQDAEFGKQHYPGALKASEGGAWRSAMLAIRHGKAAGMTVDKVVQDLRDAGYEDAQIVSMMKERGGYGQLETESAMSRLGSKEWVESQNTAAPVDSEPAAKPAAKLKMDTIIAGGKALRAKMSPEELAIDDQRGEAIKEVLKRGGTIEEISQAYDSFTEAAIAARERRKSEPSAEPPPAKNKWLKVDKEATAPKIGRKGATRKLAKAVEAAPPVETPAAAETAAVAPVASEPAPVEAEKVGDATTIMSVPSVLADTQTVGGVRWDLFNGAKMSDGRAAVRTFDVESGEVLQIKQFPDYDAAEAYYKTETGKARKLEPTAEAPPAQAKPKRVAEADPVAGQENAMTVEEQRVAANTAELDAKHRLRKPIKGKTGAEIVGYQWVSTTEEGMFRDRRVSDWSEAQTSVPTGRKIVHLFWVKTPDGAETLMGVGAAKKALGFAEQRLYSIAKQEQAAQLYWSEVWDRESDKSEKTGANTPAEANRLYRKANNPANMMWGTAEQHLAASEESFNAARLLTKNGKWIRTGNTETISEFMQRGWSDASEETPPASQVPLTKPPELMTPEEFNKTKEKVGRVSTDAEHAWDIRDALQDRLPVNRKAYDEYSNSRLSNGIGELPPGYVREGDRYVFKGESSTPTAPEEPVAGQEQASTLERTKALYAELEPNRDMAAMSQKIADLIDAKDANGLRSWVMHGKGFNDTTKKVVFRMIGKPVPSNMEGMGKAIDEWAGVSTEDRAASEQKAEEKRQAGIAAREAEINQKKESAWKASIAGDGTDRAVSYLSDMEPLRRGAAITALNKSFRFDDGVRNRREHVEKIIDAGGEVSTRVEPAVKPMTRTQFNRASNEEQRAHEKRMREGGEKTVYLVGNYDIGKHAYDYAQHLLAQRKSVTPAPAATEEAPSVPQPEAAKPAPPAPEVSYPTGTENIEQKRTRLQEIRNEASKIMLQIDDKIKEADRFAQQNNILITVGRHRGQLKKALPKSKVEPYNKLKEEIRKLNAIVAGMRENIEYPLRKEIEKAGLIATVNDASMPKLSRLAARVDLYTIDGSTVPKDIEASLMSESKAMVKQAYPDATEAEADEMAPYVRSNAAVLAKESQPITPEWIRDEGSRSMTLDISGMRRGEARKYAQQKGVLNYNHYPEAFANGESLKQFDDLLSGKVSRESVDAAKKVIDAEAKAMKAKADEAAKQAAAAAAEEEKRVQEERRAMADFLGGDLEGPVSDLRKKLFELGNGSDPTGMIEPKPVEKKVSKVNDALRAIESHASKDPTRLILNGVHVGSYKQRKVAVATDGRRLIMVPYDGEQKVDTTVQRLPPKQAKEMGKEYEVRDGTYPNFMQVVPPLADLEGEVQITPDMVARLRGAVKAARIVPGEVSMSAVVTAKINGTVSTAAINAEFVLEAIDALTAAGYVPTKILMKATYAPVMIVTENKHAFAVIMPLKIETEFPSPTSGFLHFYMNGNPVVPESHPPMTKGVGAAAARGEGEFINARRPVGETEAVNATGLRESVAEIERRALQMPPEVKDAARTFPEVAEKAWKRMQESSTAAQDLIDELSYSPRPLTDVEVATLTIEKVRRWNERNNAASETVKLANSPDESAKAAAKLRYEVAARRMEELFDVAARGRGKSITETARGLSALRMMMDDEFELVSMEQTVRDKQGGKSLSEQQQAELAKIKADYDAAKKRLDAEVNRLTEDLDAKTKELAESKANADFLKMVNEVTATQDKSPLRKKMLSLADRLEAEALASMKARGARMSAGVDPTVLLDMGKLGAAYIIRGSVTLADWTAKMRSVFADASDDDLNRARDEAERIARGTRNEAMSEQAKQRKTERGKAQGGQSELSKEVKALMREQVETGVTTLDEAIVNVHKELVDAYEGLTPEQVRDAFSDYGKARPLNADDVSRMLADLRRQAQLVASIERVQQQLAPLKSGPQRDKPSQIARQLTRELNRLMREAGIKTTNEETQIASALQAKKTRMENAIADMEKALAENKRMEPGSLLPVENDDEANQIEARLNDLREQYDAAFPREPLTIEQRLERATKAAERSLEQANQRLRDARSGKFPSKEKSALPFNERLAAVREERDAANAEVERLRELAEPGKKAIEAKKRRLQTAIKEVERRIREKDFAVREQKRIDISSDPEAMDAQIEYERVKNEYAAMKERARRDARTPLEVAKETGLEVMDAQRNILASFDVSAVGRQGWYAFMSHPVIGLKATARMLQAFKRGNSAVIAEKLRSRKNYPLYQQAKLGIVDDDGTGNFSHVEDRFRLDLVGKLPGINLSNRAYATFLNAIRADAFDSMLANSRDPSDVSREKIEALARGINELTGRGELGRLSPETLARFMWAPRFLKSAFDILTVRPLRTGTKETRIIFGKEYLRAAASMAVIYMLAGLFRGDDDEPIEWDPRSSDFGAIPVGKHKVNPMGYVRTLLTFMARNVTGVTVAGGQKRKLRKFATAFDDGAKEPQFGSGMEQVWMRFAQSKAHPTIGTAFSVFSGKEFGGKDITPGGVVKDMTIPLALREAYQTMMIDDPDAAVALSLMLMLGIDVKPDYASPEYLRFEAKDEAAFKDKVGKLLVAATDPSASDAEVARGVKASQNMSPEDRRAALRDAYTGKVGSDSYRHRMAILRWMDTKRDE